MKLRSPLPVFRTVGLLSVVKAVGFRLRSRVSGFKLLVSLRPPRFPSSVFLAIARRATAGLFTITVTLTFALTATAQNQTINGNLTVTGTIEADGQIDTAASTLTFGTQGSSYGAALLHQDNSTDTFTFLSNRNPASWLWQHTVGIAAMRLDSAHQLILYQADGTTAGVTLAPASNSIKLGTHANGTLTADANGVITAGGGFAVAGGITNTNGSLTGGTSGLTLNAGGTNQNITLSSSALGDIIFNTNGVERARIKSSGNVGIGTSTPSAGLTVSTEGLNYTDGSYFLVGSTNSTFGGGATLAGIKTAAVDGGNYNFLKLQNAAGTKFLINGAGNVGIGTTNLGAKLSVAGSISTTVSGGQTAIVPSLIGPSHAGIAFSYDPNSEGIVAYGYNFGSNPVFRVAAKPYIADSLAAWDPTSTTRLLVTADGNVGIGTTTPGARLQVVGGNARFSAVSEAWSEGIRIEVARNSWGGVRFYRGDANFNGNWAIGYKDDSTDDFVFTNNNGGTQSDRLVLTKTGNIGIGTTAPSTKLDVEGNVRVGSGANASWGDLYLSTNSGWETGAYPTIGSVGGTTGSLIMLHNPHVPFRTDNAALGNTGRAGIRAAINASASTWWDFGLAGDFFHVYRNGTGEFLRVTNTGNVGIGTTAPTAKLTIEDSDVYGPLFAANDNNTYLAFGSWKGNGGHDYRIGIDGSTLWFGAWEGYRWYRTKNGAIDMVLKNGDLGIGTTSPSAKLHVLEADGTTPLYIQGGASNAFISLNPDQALYLASAQQANASTITRNSVYLALRGNYWNGSSYTNVDANIQNVVSGANAYRMVFRTANSERMAIDQSGNVGIGTTNPMRSLHVATAAGAELVLEGTNGQTDYRKWNFYVGGPSGSPKALFLRMLNDATTASTFEAMTWTPSGNVGIGTIAPTHKLAVKGTIRAQEIIVDNTNWADYVFEEDYRLAPLAEVEQHIREKKHLPGIPSAAEVAEHGVSMGEMQTKMMAKIEELTLHLIAQEKELAALRGEVAQLKTAATQP